MRFLKVFVFLASLIPAGLLIQGALSNTLGANPIETLTRETGEWTLRFILLTLTVTPLRMLGIQTFVPVRRMLGLFTFFYATIHFVLYVWLDQFFNLDDIIKDIIDRPFIAVGFISFVLLIPLAVTSNKVMINKLGSEAWNRLHKLAYVIAIGSVVHFFMLVKQDITEPLVYIAILSGLLGIRLFRYGRSQIRST